MTPTEQALYVYKREYDLCIENGWDHRDAHQEALDYLSDDAIALIEEHLTRTLSSSMYIDGLSQKLRHIFEKEYFALDEALKEHGIDTQEVRPRVNKIAEKLDERFRAEMRAFMDYYPDTPFKLAEGFVFNTMEPWEQNLLRAWQAQQVPF